MYLINNKKKVYNSAKIDHNYTKKRKKKYEKYCYFTDL